MTTTLLVPPTRRVTLDDRAFPVAAARAWNSLPDQGRLVAAVFSAADKGPSVSAVVQLTSDYCTIVFKNKILYVKCPCDFREASL